LYFEFFHELIRDQNDRKASIEQRGLAVITSTGALVTLLFGLVTIASAADANALPRAAHGPFVAGAVLLVLAGICALLTNIPSRKYQNLDAGRTDDIFDRWWSKSKEDAELRISVMRAGVFAAAQEANNRKAKVLVIALLFEIAGVVATALAATEIVRAS
jgi:hypothetical protein